jgi:transcriptional regulator with XRE-family HTH domain
VYKKYLVGSSFATVGKKITKYKDSTFQKLLVERMQQLRKEHGYSQEDVIEFTHLDVSRYETGDSTPTLSSILKLCTLYKLTLGEFFAPLNYPPKE